MNAETRQSSSGLRLSFLLTALALVNLANVGGPTPNFDEKPSARCSCSGYTGRIGVDPPYVVLREGQVGQVNFGFPEAVRWSIARMPSPEVIAEVSSPTPVVSDRIGIGLTASDRIENDSGTFAIAITGNGFTAGPSPARRTHLSIAAEPEDSALDSRSVTILGLQPVIGYSQSFADVPKDLSVRISAEVDTRAGEWSFEFDLSDAPSLQAPSDPDAIRQTGPREVMADFPLADNLPWDVPPCDLREPIHIAARNAADGDRVVRRSFTVEIFGLPPTGEDQSCPQPADFRD